MSRILIVDDEPDSLIGAREALAAAGHDCVLAADGDRALELLAGGGFDAIVLDPAMPLHDGWPVLAAAGPLPVVAVTSRRLPPDTPLAARLAKPCRAEDLVSAVAAALGRP